MMQKTFEFKVLVTYDRSLNVWVARGVNLDIAAQAKNLDDLAATFVRCVIAQAIVDITDGNEPFANCPPAPDYVQDTFARTKNRLEGIETERSPIPFPSPYQVAAQLQEMRIAG